MAVPGGQWTGAVGRIGSARARGTPGGDRPPGGRRAEAISWCSDCPLSTAHCPTRAITFASHMKVTLLPDARPERRRRVAIGTFDGVHLGHRAVIAGADTVLTFDPHPLSVIRPDALPKLLTSHAGEARPDRRPRRGRARRDPVRQGVLREDGRGVRRGGAGGEARRRARLGRRELPLRQGRQGRRGVPAPRARSSRRAWCRSSRSDGETVSSTQIRGARGGRRGGQGRRTSSAGRSCSRARSCTGDKPRPRARHADGQHRARRPPRRARATASTRHGRTAIPRR